MAYIRINATISVQTVTNHLSKDQYMREVVTKGDSVTESTLLTDIATSMFYLQQN
jgi:hypothetical protein